MSSNTKSKNTADDKRLLVKKNETIKDMAIRHVGWWYENFVVDTIDRQLQAQMDSRNPKLKIVKSLKDDFTVKEIEALHPDFAEYKNSLQKNPNLLFEKKALSGEDKTLITNLIQSFQSFNDTEFDYVRLIYFEDDPFKETTLVIEDKWQKIKLKTPCVLYVEATIDSSTDHIKSKFHQMYKRLSVITSCYLMMFRKDLLAFSFRDLIERVKLYPVLVTDGSDKNALENFNSFLILQDEILMEYFSLPKTLVTADQAVDPKNSNETIQDRIDSKFYIQHMHIACPYSIVDLFEKVEKIDNKVETLEQKIEKVETDLSDFRTETNNTLSVIIEKLDKLLARNEQIVKKKKDGDQLPRNDSQDKSIQGS